MSVQRPLYQHSILHSSLFISCHIVKKAIPYFDPILNRTIKPISPNAYKMEYYFSDVFPLAHSISVVVIPREEFIPIKNPPGKHHSEQIIYRKANSYT